jgi:hypothetical protein
MTLLPLLEGGYLERISTCTSREYRLAKSTRRPPPDTCYMTKRAVSACFS